MKRLLLAFASAVVLLTAAAVSGFDVREVGLLIHPNLEIQVEPRNPWNHLAVNDNDRAFQFAIVTDRTGGHRPGVFEKAVSQLNLLQPEFIVSVGDLIEGGTEDLEQLDKEWTEFEDFIHQLEMPFFYVPGNHDISNPVMAKLWQEKFGRRYYHFVFHNVLFLMLNTEDPPGSAPAKLSAEQVAFARKTLADNPEVRWTIVAMHKPLWTYDEVEETGWLDVERALAGRPYTVFAGHRHRYEKFVRNGQNYYMLATTGGGSQLRGPEAGEFDHVVWVTMKDTGPVLANLMVEGIFPEDVQGEAVARRELAEARAVEAAAKKAEEDAKKAAEEAAKKEQ
jgi:hypothetical protein